MALEWELGTLVEATGGGEGAVGGQLPAVVVRRQDGRWVCQAANDLWAELVDIDPAMLRDEPVGALLPDRQTAEALGRLCDLVALTASRRRLLLPVIAGMPREATAEPLGADRASVPDVVIRLAEAKHGAPTFAHLQRSLASKSPRLVAIFDRDLRVVSVNRAVTRISGLDRAAIIGRTNAEMGYPPVVADLWDSHHRDVIATGQSRVVSYVLPTVLGPRPFESHVEPVVGEHGRIDGVMVTSRDVTALQLAAARRRDNDTDALAPGSAAWWQFDPDLRSVGHARDCVGKWLRDSGVVELEDETALVVSELAANAVLHAGTIFYVQVQRIDGGVRIEVRDPSPAWPVRRASATFGGRGLVLVDALGRCGVRAIAGGGKVVWCEVEHPMGTGSVDASPGTLVNYWSDAEA